MSLPTDLFIFFEKIKIRKRTIFVTGSTPKLPSTYSILETSYIYQGFDKTQNLTLYLYFLNLMS